MKSKYILGLVLIAVIFFQELRLNRLEDIFDLRQNYSFELEKPVSGDRIIKNPEKYLILYGNNNEGSYTIKVALEELFKFSKVKYDIYSIDTKEILNFDQYSMIIISTENYSGLLRENYIKIKERIENGGNLFIAQRSFRSPFNQLAGIEAIGNFLGTKSFNLKKDIFPGIKNLKPDDIILISSGLNVKLKKEVEIIAESQSGTPLMWINKFGKGRVFYTNSTLFQGRIFRGVMKQMIAYTSNVSFFPILNSKVLHIDDFPSPIPSVKNEIIKKEYGMDTKEFFNIIWWQDMLGIAQRQKLKMTGFLIAEYNDITTKNEIVGINKQTFSDLSKRGRELKSIGGEIGLHGYNHYSLGLEKTINFEDYGYAPWEDVKAMEKGIEVAKKEIQELYGDDFHIYSYVAPSNLLTQAGKFALINVLKDLNVFCGIFYGENEPGLLLQEIGRDNDFSKIYALPRMSSGFFYDETLLWQIYNGIAAYGYLSHFIHPDDIMDKERGDGKTWEQLKTEFEKIFATVNKNYSLLKPQIQSEMTYDYSVMENLEIDYEMKGEKVFVNIKNYCGEFDSHFRVKGKKISSISGGEFKLITRTEDDTLYIITAKKPELEIVLEEL
ncbi:DUF2194 domain-containing protein [Cetobacterium sp. ZWU0022]|uniref:DUF2194 domain-containing protein n=1 Tax=Cetobacterium sp. ZWU0022 TaxID=1340502 RepID=UPI00064852E7|nr:DUF2194 domain-containing protein [Cetobacterium sp. ZWU0022]